MANFSLKNTPFKYIFLKPPFTASKRESTVDEKKVSFQKVHLVKDLFCQIANLKTICICKKVAEKNHF